MDARRLSTDLGYQTVFEQFDGLAPNIAENLDLQYPKMLRGTFVAIRNH